jgi:integrase
MGKLTALAVMRVTAAGMHSDGDGLYLQVGAGGAKSWIYRFTLSGRERYLGLGSTNAIPLKRARELAAEARQVRAEGIDPVEKRRSDRVAKRVESTRAITFDQCASAYIAAHEAGWRNAKHRYQWRATLRDYASPVFGHFPVQDIDTNLVMRVIEPLWRTKTETASRTRQRIEAILDWATVREYRQGANPARWRGHLQKLLPAKAKVSAVEHLAAMPYADIPAFMAAMRTRESVSARCLELTILTAARTGETINTRWSEFDLDTRVWVIPGSRMKMGAEHRIPLAPRAVDILREIYSRRAGEFVFANVGTGRPISDMTMRKLLTLAGHSQLTVHGFRSTFTDWAHECTEFPDIVIDMALAHKVSDKVQAAYRRGDLFEKRRKLMEAWANYCSRPAFEGDVMPTRHSTGAAS